MLFPVWLLDQFTVQPAQTFAAFSVTDSPGQSSVSPLVLMTGIVGAAWLVSVRAFDGLPVPQVFEDVAV